MLPKNSLLIKLSNRLDVSNRKKRNSEKSVSHKNAISNKYKTLNPKLQLLFDEYCDFKIHSKQPEIRNISNTSKDSDYFELVNKVTETGYSVGWSFNSLMICNSQQAFFKDLIGFLNFCTRELNINYDDIGSEHLTNPKIIYELSNYGKSLKSGGSWIVNLLRFIKRTIAPKGYLRLCGHLGDRTFDKFNADLDFLNEAYEQLLKDAKKGVFKSKKMSDQGKKSINFLLNMDVNERIAVMKKANDFIYKVATSHHLEYKRCLKLANKKVSESASKKSLSKARTAIHYAYNHMFALLMKETASVNCPRLSNWIMMKYYPSTKEQDKSTASFTYLRQRNQFNLHVPLTGTSVLPEFDDHAYRYLKNAEAPLTVPIDIDLPKSLTPLIKKFIAIREDYIYLDICKDTDIDPKSIALLFPWKRVQDRGTNGGFNEGKEIKKLHKKNYIAQPDKLNKTFEGVMRSAYSHVLPYVKQHGFNPHALRHLAVETHLDLYPDDIAGAATILNDDPKQVWKTYGNKDRSKVMQRVSKLERYGNSYE